MTAGVEGEPVDPPVIAVSGPSAAQDAAERPRAPITVEQAYLAKLRAAGAPPPSPAPPPPAPPPAPPLPPPPPAAARVDRSDTASSPSRRASSPNHPAGASVRTPPAAPPPHLRARPRIEPEQGILGLSRHTRSRLGSRLFNLFFVCVFALILVQMVVVLLAP